MKRDFKNIDKLTKDTTQVFLDIENDMLDTIFKEMYKDVGLSEEEWKNKKIQDKQSVNKQLSKAATSEIREQNKAIESVLDTVLRDSIAEDINVLELASKQGFLRHVPQEQYEDVVSQLITNNRILVSDHFNQTRQYMYNDSLRKYDDIINKATVEFLSGDRLITDIVYDLNKQISNDGIVGYIDKLGRHWSGDTYLNGVIQKNALDISIYSTQQANALYGNSFIEISSHGEAREKCFKDQGRIYDQNNTEGYIIDGDGKKIKYYSWGNTSYGDVDGILGFRCRHNMYVFIPGFSTQSFPKNNTYKSKTNEKEKAIRKQENYVKGLQKKNERNYQNIKNVRKGFEEEKKRYNNLLSSAKTEEGKKAIEKRFKGQIDNLERKITKDERNYNIKSKEYTAALKELDRQQKILENTPF